MSKKNIFVSNAKEITIGKGKLNLLKATPEFKDRVQLFADGINAMNDKALYYGDCAKTARHSLELYLKGTYIDSSVVAQKECEIAEYLDASAKIRAEIQAKMPEFDKVDKNLYYAYRQYANGEVDYDVYVRAFAEWLDNAGIMPTDKGIDLITSKIGVNKASARTMCKNGGTVFTNAKGEKQFLDLVYRIVADLMYAKNILKPFVYEYTIEDKKAKKAEVVETEKAETVAA
jgi:hypothetical protein